MASDRGEEKLAHPQGASGSGRSLQCALAIVLGISGIAAAWSVAVSAETQSDGGRSIYSAQCAGCHGERLQGGFGPALVGNAFRQKWSAKTSDALFDYIAANMPPAAVGSLTQPNYHDVTHYIRAQNAFPEGEVADKSPQSSPALEPSGPSVMDESGVPINALVATPNQKMPDPVAERAFAERRALLQALRPVTDQMLRDPSPDDWLNWRRTDDGNGYSPLDRITKTNVGQMKLAWSLALSTGTNEITPLVHDGVMFINSSGTVVALDVATGDVLWTFARKSVPMQSVGVPHTQPRSMAIYGNALYVPTSDNHMLALDQRTGKLIWDHVIAESGGVLRPSSGPVVVHGKIIQGETGCTQTFPGGCFIVALDAASGRELWRFNTLQRPGEGARDSWSDVPLEERLGGGVWSAGSYDPQLNLVYFGVGQTYHISPLMKARGKGGSTADGLYTDSTLALNPDTGKLVWHYQHLARDVWDMDWSFERTLMTLGEGRTSRRVVATMGKLGILDVLDATTGRYIFSTDLGLQDLVTGIDPRTGKKSTAPSAEPKAGGSVHFCPMPVGVRNWPSTSYDSQTKMLYVPVIETCTNEAWTPGSGGELVFEALPRPDSDGKIGQVAAIDLSSRKIVWQQRRRAPQASAILATAGGLIFEGGRDRWFRASDGKTGAVLWQTRLGNVPNAFPISFGRNGRQFIAITTGSGNMIEPALRSLTPEIDQRPAENMLWVFVAD